MLHFSSWKLSRWECSPSFCLFPSVKRRNLTTQKHQQGKLCRHNMTNCHSFSATCCTDLLHNIHCLTNIQQLSDAILESRYGEKLPILKVFAERWSRRFLLNVIISLMYQCQKQVFDEKSIVLQL